MKATYESHLQFIVPQLPCRRRTRSRPPLGALPADIIKLVVRQGMELAVIGIVAGIVGAALLSQVMSSMLFEVSTRDASTFVAVPSLLAVVAFVATVLPAWRTTRVDPMAALREE